MAVLTLTSADAANRAYKTLQEARLHETESNHGDDTILKIEKGDTVYATEQTFAYITEKEGQAMHYIPVEYKGKKGWISLSNVYPIKLEPEDVLVFDHSVSLKDRSAIGRYMTPTIEKVKNLPVSHMGWIYWTIILTAMAALVFFMAYGAGDNDVLDKEGNPVKKSKAARFMEQHSGIFYCVCAILLVGVSFTEMMYVFSFYDHILWFAKPSVVGGWGHVILNFFIFSTVIATQTLLIYMVWKETIRAGKYDKWVNNLAFAPIALGFIFMIMYWVDYASDTPIEAKTYMILFWALVIVAVIGMIYLIKGKHYIEALIIPVCFVGASIGLTVLTMVLSMLMVLVIIVGAIGALLIGAVLGGVCGLLFGKKMTTGVTDDGRKVKGWTDANGVFHGDDGNLYNTK